MHKNSTIKGLDYPNLNPSRCGSPILIWGREYFVQSSDNAHSDNASDRFKFIDDLSIVELICLAGMPSEYKFESHILSDIAIDQLSIPTKTFTTLTAFFIVPDKI